MERESEIRRRRLAAALPSMEGFLVTRPPERADALTVAWDLRWRWGDLSADLESHAQYRAGASAWIDEAAAARELADRLLRCDRCMADLLALSRRSVGDCAAALRDAEESRITAAGGEKRGWRRRRKDC